MTPRLKRNLELLRYHDAKSVWLLTQAKSQKFKNSKKKIEEWFSGISLKGIKALIIYGIGSGEIYPNVKKWLKGDKTRSVVFLEDDKNVLYTLMESELGTKFLTDPQIDIHFYRKGLDEKELIEILAWDFIFQPFDVVALPTNRANSKKQFEKLKFDITDHFLAKNAVVDEYRYYGAAFLRNFYPNLLLLPGAHLGNKLFDKFKNVPAIICGAGASLNKNGKLLQNLDKKALIFAGGSALNVLQESGVEPHIGAGIDPNALQYDRLSALKDFEMPFLYRNRLFHSALKRAKGAHLYITGSSGYDIAGWFEERLGIKCAEIEEGHNVVNFCVEVACSMGCNPIILVGVDLAFTKLQAYAKGVVKDASVSQEEILKGNNLDEIAVPTSDIDGKKTYTLWKWIAESEWISNYAKTHPHVKFFNSTEGGIGFEGIPNVTLKEVIKIHFGKNHQITKKLTEAVEKAKLKKVTKNKVIKLMEVLKDSLGRCIDHCDGLLQEIQRLRDKINNGEHLPDDLQTGISALYESDLGDEDGFKALLDIFNAVYIKSCQREIRVLLKPGRRLSDKQIKLKKLDLSEGRFQYLKEAAHVNMEMIRLTLNGEIQKILTGAMEDFTFHT